MELRNGTVVGQNFLPPQSRPLFEEGARLVFSKWTALTLAVEHQWGGTNSAEKAEALLRDCLEWFYRKREHYVDELEEELDEAILHDFNVEAEDGSPTQAAEALIKLYAELVQGKMEYLEHLRALSAAGAHSSKRQVVDMDGTVMEADDGVSSSSSGEDDSDDAMEDAEAPQGVPLEGAGHVPQQRQERPQPVIDEDGFELVQKGGRRGGR